MSRITVLGGTGYTGSNIAREAVARGHQVSSFSRNPPETAVDGVVYRTGSIETALPALVSDADVVIGALAPRGELASELKGVYASLATEASSAGTRIGIVGGFSALRPAADAPRMAYGDDVPPQFAVEARVMAEVIDDLIESTPAELDWFYVSPAATYGSYAPGEDVGTYRTGGEVAIFDESGSSAVSGVDFARAVLDEVETPAYSRAHFGVAY